MALETLIGDRMKKLKIGLLIVMVSLLFLPAVQAIEPTQTSYVTCGSATNIPAPIPQLTSIAYTLIVIAAPIILIIFSIVALVKAIVAGTPDEIMKAKGKLIKKFIATAVIFFVAGITQFVVTQSAAASENASISECLSCFLYNDGCQPSGQLEAYQSNDGIAYISPQNLTK